MASSDEGMTVRRVRVMAAAVLTAALLTSCVRPVDVQSSGMEAPVSTQAVPSTTRTGTGHNATRPPLHESDLPSTLRVAITFDQPGVGLREGGKFTGIDADIARYIAGHLGVPQISFVEAVADQRETLLATRQADLVLASYSMTPARADKVTFAGPYLTTGQELLVSARSSIRTPRQLRGFTVCSVQGSTSTSELVKDHPGLHLTVQPRVSDCVALLEQGKVKAVTSDAAILQGFVRASRAPDKLRLSGAPFSPEHWGVAMRRADVDLCKDVSAALAKMVQSGAWKRAVRDNLGDSSAVGARTLTPPKPRPCPAPRLNATTATTTLAPG